MNLHPSHKLWLAGGLAFCSQCGSVSAGTVKTRLSVPCGSKPGKKTTRPKLVGQTASGASMPAGSVYRTKKLLRGELKGTGKANWPDGTRGNVAIIPTRVFPHPVEQASSVLDPDGDSD